MSSREKVVYPFKGNVPPSADEGRKHDVRLKEPVNDCTRSVDAETDKRKRIQFLVVVIKQCFMEPQSSITIHDTDMGKKYSCKLKTRNDPIKIDTYICKGWYKFVEARCLGKADLLKFSIEYPSASCLSVLVDKD
ncbi:hypothetical protein RYX36_002943 [Vicia faba]